MITKIAIENFKGIRDRLEFDLKPVTLLFGANSAGKSTILHALHFAREIFERHNLNPDRTVSGGKYVDLGGFDGFVHGKTRERTVRLGITVDLSQNPLPDHEVDYSSSSVLPDSDFDRLVRNATTCAVEVSVAWSSLENCPYVASTKVFYNGAIYAELTAEANLGGAAITRLEAGHEALTRIGDLNSDADRQSNLFDETLLGQALETYSEFLAPGEKFAIELAGRSDALPDLDDDWEFVTEALDIPTLPKGASEADINAHAKRQQEADRLTDGLAVLSKAIIESIEGPLQLVRNLVQEFRYLGPLRDTPPRNYEPPRFFDPARWASGLGAWDTLQTAPDDFVDDVASWLVDEDRLNSGYRVERRHYREFDLADPFLRKLMAGRAFDEADETESVDLTQSTSYSRLVVVPENSPLELRPHDVGIGISQVVPVVVTALDGNKRLIAIEQPELHLHPRLAAALADLFISAACGPRQQQFILETHSELIPLRVLRRIREAEAGKGTGHQLKTQDVVIYYVRQRDGCTERQRIDVDAQGEFIQPWPDDFFEIDFHERFG